MMIIKNKIILSFLILVALVLVIGLIQGCKTDEYDEPAVDHGVFSGIPNNYRIGSVKIPGQAIDVDISGNYAYLTNDLGVLYIINIVDKEKPFVYGKCPDIDSANIVIARNDTAYISYTEWLAGEEEYYTECGFKIVDISDKENPVVVGDYNTGNGNRKSVFGLFIDEDHAYLNTTTYFDESESSTLEIIDITSNSKPSIEGSISIKGSPANIWIEGDRAYLNTNYYDYEENDYTGESKFIIIDISDKSNPAIVSSIDVPSNSWGIYIYDDNAYLSSHRSSDEEEYYDSMLQVIDISNDIKPELSGSVKLPGGAWEIDMAGDFVYISDLTGGIYTIDISDSNNPFIAGRLNTSGTSYDITTKGNYGYIADGFEGITIAGLSKEDDASSTFLTGENENMSPRAIIDIFGDQAGDYYIAGTPVVFSGLNAFDPEGSSVTYLWTIEDDIIKDLTSIDYIFEQPGDYEISLKVDDGYSTDTATINILVADINHPLENMVTQSFSVEIEYILTNNSMESLNDIECFMRIPFSYSPYQEINGIETSIPVREEIFDNHWNKLFKFEIEDDLLPGEKLSIKSIIDITMFEFDYSDIGHDLYYDEDDPDLVRYTGEDLFIDSDNPDIEDLSRRIIGNETSPIKIAGLLYNHIVRNLYYDYDRAEDREYEFMNASEILEIGKGVCSDYSILYTAMLRSVGIPARLAAGIPVYTILYETGKEIDVGHAWVEIKIPGYGWVPVDITTEENFWTSNYFMDIVTERGPGYIYEHSTMDWGSYYYDGFDYSWDGQLTPEVDQDFIFRVKDLELKNILKD
jgi:hypothetical protein